MKRRLYIAYGSNLNQEQMAYRCPDAAPVAITELEGYRLAFTGRTVGAHATILPDEGYKVPVVIWEISKRDEMTLDIYEGVKGGYYTKEYMTVDIGDGEEDALVYIMRPQPDGLPTDSYLRTIAEGYRDFDLDIIPLNEAAKYAERKSRRYAGKKVTRAW